MDWALSSNLGHMKDTRLHETDDIGQFVKYSDDIDYSPIMDKNHPMCPQMFKPPQEEIAHLLENYDAPPELIPVIEDYISDQTRIATLEFINRFLAKLSQNLHGFCLLRALGYDVMVEHNGKPITSLRQMSEHFQVSHQYIHKLTKDYSEQIGMSKPKQYKTRVTAPDGYITLGEAMKKYKLSRHKLKQLIKATKAQVISYKRNSKVMLESIISSYLH